MRVMPNFATPLCYDMVEGDVSHIEQYVYDLKNASNAPVKAGGWQSGALDLTAKELEPVIKAIDKMISEINILYNLQPNFTFKLEDGWINVNARGPYMLPDNYYHLHPQNFFSFVYYVKAHDLAGNLTIMSPYQMLEYALPDRAVKDVGMFNSPRLHVTPEAGQLIAFPSWLMHFVDANNSDDDRISIAFNARLVEINP